MIRADEKSFAKVQFYFFQTHSLNNYRRETRGLSSITLPLPDFLKSPPRRSENLEPTLRSVRVLSSAKEDGLTLWYMEVRL